jgi:alcohol dehydrogenase, propanol-preferring
MRAAVLVRTGQPLQLRGVPRPVPGSGQILVRLESCGVCHTDLHVWSGSAVPANRPDGLILGHEGVGRIAEVGSGVAHLQAGMLVGVPWLHDTCGHCTECLAGHESFCQAHRAHGFDVHGAFAEYVVVDQRFAVPLDERVDTLQTAPLMCAGITAYGAVKKARLGPGMTCAIFGCGGLGQYAIQLARRCGATVIALDLSDSKLSAAHDLGADHTIRMDGEAIGRLKAIGGAEACINFAPSTATWAAITAAIKPRGRIIAAAMVSEPVPLNQEWLTATGVEITGTSVGTRLEMRELMRIHDAHPLAADIRPIRLEDINDGLVALSRGQVSGRLVINFAER